MTKPLTKKQYLKLVKTRRNIAWIAQIVNKMERAINEIETFNLQHK
jgi:hypothetical protein